jgi:hypothetical protein
VTEQDPQTETIPVQPATFYLTFGQQYPDRATHPTIGNAHRDGYLEVRAADVAEARATAFAWLGRRWSDLYTDHSMSASDRARYYSRGVLGVLYADTAMEDGVRYRVAPGNGAESDNIDPDRKVHPESRTPYQPNGLEWPDEAGTDRALDGLDDAIGRLRGFDDLRGDAGDDGPVLEGLPFERGQTLREVAPRPEDVAGLSEFAHVLAAQGRAGGRAGADPGAGKTAAPAGDDVERLSNGAELPAPEDYCACGHPAETHGPSYEDDCGGITRVGGGSDAFPDECGCPGFRWPVPDAAAVDGHPYPGHADDELGDPEGAIETEVGRKSGDDGVTEGELDDWARRERGGRSESYRYVHRAGDTFRDRLAGHHRPEDRADLLVEEAIGGRGESQPETLALLAIREDLVGHRNELVAMHDGVTHLADHIDKGLTSIVDALDRIGASTDSLDANAEVTADTATRALRAWRRYLLTSFVTGVLLAVAVVAVLGRIAGQW